jgi:hypothetical protein
MSECSNIPPYSYQNSPHYSMFSFLACPEVGIAAPSGAEGGRRRLAPPAALVRGRPAWAGLGGLVGYICCFVHHVVSSQNDPSIFSSMRHPIHTVNGRARPPSHCKLPSSLSKTYASHHRMALRRSTRHEGLETNGESTPKGTGGGALERESAPDTVRRHEAPYTSSDDEGDLVSSDLKHPVPWDCEICHVMCQDYDSQATSLQKLIKSARSGQQCCSIILDAILTWIGPGQLSSKSFPDSLHGIVVQVRRKWSFVDKSYVCFNVELAQILEPEENPRDQIWKTLTVFGTTGTLHGQNKHTNLPSPDIRPYRPSRLHFRSDVEVQHPNPAFAIRRRSFREGFQVP